MGSLNFWSIGIWEYVENARTPSLIYWDLEHVDDASVLIPYKKGHRVDILIPMSNFHMLLVPVILKYDKLFVLRNGRQATFTHFLSKTSNFVNNI